MEGKCVKCVYDFTAETDTDLGMRTGDIIKVTKVINSDWYQGQLNGANGQFPVAYTEPCDDVFDLAVAINDFIGQQEGDLSFNQGDFIIITEVLDENWVQGYIQGGGHGMFPRAYVKEFSLEDSAMREQPIVSTEKEELSESVDEVTVQSTIDTNKQDEVSSEPSVIQNEDEMKWVDVLESFNAMDSNELDLVAGTKVLILGDVDGFWCRGSFNGKEGIFPRNFVDLPEIVTNNEIIKENNEHSDEVVPIESETVIETNSLENEAVENKAIGRVAAIFDFLTQEQGDLSFKIGDEIMLIEKINDNWMRGQINDRIGIFPSSYVEVQEMFPVQTECEVKSEEVETEKKTELYENHVLSKEPSPSSTIEPSLSPTEPVDSNLEKQRESLYVNTTIPIPMTTTTKVPPVKPNKPQRPKLPESKKPVDENTPFSYQFKTKSQPIVIIPSKYLKTGSSNVLLLKNWINEPFAQKNYNGDERST